MCLFGLNILEIIFTCIALEIYDEKNFDPSHAFHRVKKMNMKDVVSTVMTDTYTCFVCFFVFFLGGWEGGGVTLTESRYGIDMILICWDYFGRNCKMIHSYYHHLFF